MWYKKELSPAMVPLLAINPARSSCLLSIWKSFRQPINSLLLNGKLSAPLGTPPRNSGPVRSRDLRNEIKRCQVNKMKGCDYLPRVNWRGTNVRKETH